MTNLTFRPLKMRPPNWTGHHIDSPFGATLTSTMELLDRELRQLGATNAFLQVDVPEDQIRRDGMLRANAAAFYPGAILTIETRKHGTLVYPCDRFRWWQDNLRAIALGLEALRKIERYGIAERGQQYAGFNALGSGTPMGSGAMTPHEAAALISEHATGLHVVPDSSEVLIGVAYRSGIRKHHPDVGGDPETFRRLTEARDILLGPS